MARYPLAAVSPRGRLRLLNGAHPCHRWRPLTSHQACWSARRKRFTIDTLTLLVGLAIFIGLAGIVIPVLPGSILIGVAVLVWAVAKGGLAWAVVAGVAVLLALGAASTYVSTAKHTKAAGVPTKSLVGAGLAGIIGFFAIPVVGLVVGFPRGLFGMEYFRLRDLGRAKKSALGALKAVGLGMVLELGFALAAASLWLVAVNVWV